MYSSLLESARHTTIQKQFIDVLSKNNGTSLYVNEAKITTPDVTTDDAIVHVIDKVLIPLGGERPASVAKKDGKNACSNQKYFQKV